MFRGGDGYRPDWDLLTALGLGHATASIGQQEGKPYLSIFDSWDLGDSRFNDYDRAAGTPFNVYDRLPIPLVNGVIPKYIRGRLTDVDLPVEGLKNAATR